MAKKTKATLTAEDRKLLKSFGKRVLMERERKKLSVYDVTGEDLPIKTRQHWQAIEAGRKNINFTTVFKVADSLNLPPEDLIKGVKK